MSTSKKVVSVPTIDLVEMSFDELISSFSKLGDDLVSEAEAALSKAEKLWTDVGKAQEFIQAQETTVIPKLVACGKFGASGLKRVKAEVKRMKEFIAVKVMVPEYAMIAIEREAKIKAEAEAIAKTKAQLDEQRKLLADSNSAARKAARTRIWENMENLYFLLRDGTQLVSSRKGDITLLEDVNWSACSRIKGFSIREHYGIVQATTEERLAYWLPCSEDVTILDVTTKNGKLHTTTTVVAETREIPNEWIDDVRDAVLYMQKAYRDGEHDMEVVYSSLGFGQFWPMHPIDERRASAKTQTKVQGHRDAKPEPEMVREGQVASWLSPENTAKLLAMKAVA